MPRLHPLLAVLATCATLAAAPSHAVNLVANGSFETPQAPGGYAEYGGGDTTMTGWTTVLSGVEQFNPSIYGLGAAPDGNMVIDLANFTYSNGGVEQSITTTAGQAYTLSFMAGNTTFAGRTGDAIIHVTIDGVTTDVATPTVATTVIGWEARSVNFTAASASTTVRLWNDQDSYTHFALVDSVSAAPVPEPETWALMASGLIGVLSLARRRRTA